MSGIAVSGAGHERTLEDELREIAGTVGRAARFADGEYLPQMSRQHELVSAFRDSEHAVAAIERIAPRIAVLDGGDDGLQLAKQALVHLASGRMSLRDGVAVGDDLVRGGTIVEDAIATGSAGMLFRAAETKVRGIADIARLESMSPDEAFAALLAA